jgi:hypothetical protein
MKRILVIVTMILIMTLPATAADKPDPALEAWQQKVDKVTLEKENAILRMQIMQINHQQQQDIFQQKEKELKALQAVKPGKKDEKKKEK